MSMHVLAHAAISAWLACFSAPQSSKPQTPTTQVEPIEILTRDPAKLPRSAGERWKSWSTLDPIPREFAPTFGAAVKFYAAGNYAPALRLFYELLEREPDFPPALYQAGLCYFRLRRYRDCATLVERFVEVAPHEVGATQVLGHCYYSLGRYPQAKAQYERVLAESPQSVEALRGYGLTQMRLGDSSAALSTLRKVVELKPDHADAHTWIAQILYDLGQSEEALASARRAKQLDPYEPKPWFIESQALLDLGREDEAKASRARFEELSRAAEEIKDLEGLMLHVPHQLEPLKRLISVQAAIGDRKAVRELFARLWRDQPNDVALRIFALDTWCSIADEEASRAAALDLERIGAADASAWKRLETYYGSVRDRVRQVEAGERYLRLRGDAKTGKQ